MFVGLSWQYLIGYIGGLGAVLLLAALAVAVRQKLRRSRSRYVSVTHATLSLLLTLLVCFLFEGYFAFIYDTTDAWGLLKTTRLWLDRHAPTSTNLATRGRGLVMLQKPPDTTRIFFLGDSFAWGHGIARERDRFSNLIAAALKTARSADDHGWSGRLIECENISYLGVDTGDELDILRNLLADGFEFDSLILVYCLNDISDLLPECQSVTRSLYEGQPDCLLVRDTYFLNFLYHRWASRRTRAYTYYYREVREGYWGPTWDAQRQRLEEMVGLCRQAGIEFRVVTFPFRHDLGPNYSFVAAHEKLGQLWAELEVPHLDLLGTFSGYDHRCLVVNRFDPHPNELAHRLAARAILERWFPDVLDKP